MTRFARAKGSKASNERVPEEATSWNQIKDQLKEAAEAKEFEAGKKVADAARIAEYKEFYKKFRDEQKKKDTISKWADFQATTTKPSMKEREPKKANTELITKPDMHSDTPEEKITTTKPAIKKGKAFMAANAQLIIKPDIQSSDTTEQEISNTKPAKKQRKSTNANTEQITKPDIKFSDTTEQKITNAKPAKKQRKPKKANKQITKPDIQSSDTTEQKDNNAMPLAKIELNPTDACAKKKETSPKKRIRKRKPSKPNQTDIHSSDTTEQKDSKEMPLAKIELNPTNTDASAKQEETSPKKKRRKPNQTEPTTAAEGNKTSPKKNNHKNNKSPDGNPAKHASPQGKKSPLGEYKRRKPLQQTHTMEINGRTFDLVYVDGFPVTKEAKERLDQLRKSMIARGLPYNEVAHAMKLARRRCEKELAREKKSVCFKCRKGGHLLAECPENNDGVDGGEAHGVCFKCGSTEHSHLACKVVRGEEFRFATCYICKQQGHISRQCPDNQRGLYPRGGACNVCGDVTHLKKDCPTYVAQQEQDAIRLDTIDTANPDAMTVDGASPPKRTQVAQKNKIITF